MAGATGRTAADNAWYSDVYGFRGSFQERIDGLRHRVVDDLLKQGAADLAPLGGTP